MTKNPGRRSGGGPKTEEGKKRSSLNALKHGLRAEAPHALESIPVGSLDCPSGVEFEPILQKVRDYFQPTNPVEEELVCRIARCQWRIARIGQMEDQLIKQNPFKLLPVTSGAALMRYERQADLHLHRAIRSLESLRKCTGSEKKTERTRTRST